MISRFARRGAGVEWLRIISRLLLILPLTLSLGAAVDVAPDSMTRTHRLPPASSDDRLSLASCRRILGLSQAEIPDHELLRTRDALYQFAEVAVRRFENTHPGRDMLNAAVQTENQDAIVERAAILEFDAGYSRSRADRLARQRPQTPRQSIGTDK
jgi:hypothetical protein